MRGDQYPAQSFTDNGNGTVTDNRTGLMWQQAEPGYKTWQAALDYCNGLVLGDMTDWRLPNIKELESIVNDTIFMPAIDTNFFPNAHSEYYWASTTCASYLNSAWGVFFYTGDGFVSDADNKGYVSYLRCVREPLITPAGLTLTSPNGGETWLAGTTQTITWSYTGNPGTSVKIKLLLNGMAVKTITASTPVGSNGSGSFDWNIPLSQVTGAKYRIKIMSTIDGSFKDTSDANFAISPPSITVTSPNGGESWTRGTQQLIQWTYKGNPGEYVKIKLLRRGVTVRTITPSSPIGGKGNGSFAWDIPLDLAIGGKYQIKIISTGSYKDKSDGNFILQ